MSDLRTAAQQALEALEGWENHDRWVWPESALEQAKRNTTDALTALRAALAEPEEDPELSAALGWAAGISEPVLDRKALLRRVAEIATDMQAKTKRAWDVGYDCGIKAASEFAEDQIGRATTAEAALQMTKVTHALKIAAVEAQRDALLEALKYHQEQTRPIQRTIDAIKAAEGEKR